MTEEAIGLGRRTGTITSVTADLFLRDGHAEVGLQLVDPGLEFRVIPPLSLQAVLQGLKVLQSGPVTHTTRVTGIVSCRDSKFCSLALQHQPTRVTGIVSCSLALQHHHQHTSLASCPAGIVSSSVWPCNTHNSSHWHHLTTSYFSPSIELWSWVVTLY